MKVFTMFILCEEPDGYFIYYNYENKKLYGCYTTKTKVKTNYNLLLVLPFINAAVRFFNKWLANWNIWGMRLNCIFAILVTTICITVFWNQKFKSAEEYRKRRYTELPEPTQNEWNYYLQRAKEQIAGYNQICIWMLLGLIVSIGLFLWNGFILFLLLYLLIYFISYPFIFVVKPIRKYNFIKSKQQFMN